MRTKLNITEGIFPMPVLMVATYNEDGSVNVMNAAWGTMQERDSVVLNLTETHKTVQNIKARGAFTAWSADSSSIRTMNTDAALSARWSMSLPMRALWGMGKLICLRSTPSHLTPTPTAIIKSPSVWAKHSEMA